MWDSIVHSPYPYLYRDPEYRGKYQRPQREEDYRNPKPRGLKYETSDRGLALVENLEVLTYLQILRTFLEFSQQRNVRSTDLSQLRTQLREEALRESDQVREDFLFSIAKNKW